MQFILENYLIIILVGLFFIFALIGYLIDLFRKNTKEIVNQANKIEPAIISELKEEPNNNINNKDELIEDNIQNKIIEKTEK